MELYLSNFFGVLFFGEFGGFWGRGGEICFIDGSVGLFIIYLYFKGKFLLDFFGGSGGGIYWFCMGCGNVLVVVLCFF